ncbi:uncharacterized protein BO80DRAFT_279275 [Aspergillus ibericus CBS 121593]|uniref:Secreted protein n=1 Tax=Aspergillus ibericus CBS 121593 TaxID=1448316 RepID=A0A395GI60_9EURO|nr:hypothetical protein BO80DRAFT_279275 [Aspergillus ibericus CBS 121593]RAK95110.1 hypothetical protein BO80DRAFT_279275 [Aspergillus ibericus CBS 121593]
MIHLLSSFWTVLAIAQVSFGQHARLPDLSRPWTYCVAKAKAQNDSRREIPHTAETMFTGKPRCQRETQLSSRSPNHCERTVGDQRRKRDHDIMLQRPQPGRGALRYWFGTWPAQLYLPQAYREVPWHVTYSAARNDHYSGRL